MKIQFKQKKKKKKNLSVIIIDHKDIHTHTHTHAYRIFVEKKKETFDTRNNNNLLNKVKISTNERNAKLIWFFFLSRLDTSI